MKDTNYRASAIQKIGTTKRALDKLMAARPEDATLKMTAALIIDRMEFMNKALESWYRDGIEDRWDAETIQVGKAACLGNIDSLELLVCDMRRSIQAE